MLKLSWEQYLSIDISEKEKKNTIFFN
jgi:hypothetical protein